MHSYGDSYFLFGNSTTRYSEKSLDAQHDELRNHLNPLCTRADISALIQGSIRQIEALFGKPFDRMKGNEKTIIGSVFEANFKNFYRLPTLGLRLDTEILQISVDIKFTTKDNWMIPPSCVNEWLLLVVGNPVRQICGLGLLYAAPSVLTLGPNADRKLTISAQGRRKIEWIVPLGRLDYSSISNAENPLLGDHSMNPYQRYIELIYEACHSSEVVDYFDLRGDGVQMRNAWDWLVSEQREAFKALAEHVRDHAEAILTDIAAQPSTAPIEPPSALLRATDLMQARHAFLSRYAITAEQAAIAADAKPEA